MAPRRPLVIAHRGDSAAAPENTLAAFAAAIDAGAVGIELDVHPSRDGALVVHHDHYLDRTTSGAGLVSDHTLAELRALDAGLRVHGANLNDAVAIKRAAASGIDQFTTSRLDLALRTLEDSDAW